jgi:hypothetical protein
MGPFVLWRVPNFIEWVRVSESQGFSGQSRCPFLSFWLTRTAVGRLPRKIIYLSLPRLRGIAAAGAIAMILEKIATKLLTKIANL